MFWSGERGSCQSESFSSAISHQEGSTGCQTSLSSYQQGHDPQSVFWEERIGAYLKIHEASAILWQAWMSYSYKADQIKAEVLKNNT